MQGLLASAFCLMAHRSADVLILDQQEFNKGIVHHIPRGKLVGGSSGINYMMYV